MPTSVSVIIPTYNQSRLLCETVNSILAQTYAPSEIVILDDGSTDDTASVVRRMPSIVKYHYKSNGGICAARNAGASLASCPYIAFCDHDDLWREDKLERQMELHQRVPELKYSFTNFALVSDGAWASVSKFDTGPADFLEGCREVLEGGVVCEISLYERLLRFQPIWPSTVVLTGELFRSLGGFNEAFGRNPSEDLEFTLRCLQQGPVGIVTEPVVGVRKHTMNYSGSNYRNTLGQIEVLRYVLDHHAIPEATRKKVQEQIAIRRVDASGTAFEMAQFDVCKELLAEVPKAYLTPKVRAKQIISDLPHFLSRWLHALLVRRHG